MQMIILIILISLFSLLKNLSHLIKAQIRFELLIMAEQIWLSAKQPVWILKNAIFLKAIVQTVNSDNVVCSTEEGNLIQAKKNLVFQRNPAYRQFSVQRWDLMDTDVLNEPEVLKTLKFRLQNKRIYTFIENSLLSVNPYTSIPILYSDELKEFYEYNIIQCQQNMRDFEPHIYSIVAFMLSQLQKKIRNQAVIISGQSGAGKTQANKQCLRFLQHYFKVQVSGSLDQNIDNILSLSTPILQAFGNSKTIRNNNSSRFGKYLNIFINQSLQIKHVKIFNYLLQKSRIISRAENEQNFHIFYELLKGLSKVQKNKYFLENKDGRQYKLEDFTYLRTAKVAKYDQHPQISFQKVKQSLHTLKDTTAYDFVCRVLSAILLLGNVIPYENQNEDRCLISNEDVLLNICQLLKIKKEVLRSALTCYPIKIGSQTLTKYFNARQVQQLINSLSKILYERLFQWIINQINSLSEYSGQEKLNTLGFLDIYGFEILQSNSLQQLFINYTNQRLHQIYLSKIFKDEGQLFKNEGLSNQFKAIPYTDNMAILELIDYEQLSIFNSLDEWCSVATPDDSSFITKLRHKHKKHPAFPTSNFNLPSTMFVIRHSPKDIQYTVAGFRDKNKDLVRDQIRNAMKSSNLPNLVQIFDQNPDAQVKKNDHKLKKFLSLKFRHQMNNLIIDLLGKCDLHFIRCVKSNSFKQALMMEDEVVYNQICYLGILDTIKLKKLGYCIKLYYDVFDKRFKWLVRHYFTQPAFPKEIMKALKDFLPRFDQDEFIFGKNMVFFRDFAYTTLVKKYQQYLEELNAKCRKIQGLLLKNRYLSKLNRKKKTIRLIKNYMIATLTSKKHQFLMRRLVIIQKAIRQKLHSLKTEKKTKQMLILQMYIKKQVCRRNRLKFNKSIQIIINAIQRYKIKKQVQKYAIINKIKNYILQKSYMKLTIKKKNLIQSYLLGFLTQLGSKNQIMAANLNTKKKFKERYIKTFSQYFSSFSETLKAAKYIKRLIFTQSVIKTWIYRTKYVRLRQSAITIQKAYRQYYFNKNTAKQIFNINFGEYKNILLNQNDNIRKFLYLNSINDSLRILYSNYFKKFKDKCSLFYFIIDFQSFVNIDLCYPDNSWLLNYFQVVKESFEKDNPIQSIDVGETFTVASTTNKLYLWGMNDEFDTLEKTILIKPQKENRIQKTNIGKNTLQIIYQSINKDSNKSYETVTKIYSIQNGKINEFCNFSIRMLKFPIPNQRILQVSCGSNHTILRSFTKRVYTFGCGREGQLGHGHYYSVDNPKQLQLGQLKNYHPLQVIASFNSTIILLSNRKIFWFGSNGTIEKIKYPILLDIQKKFEEFSGNEFAPMRIKATWSRSMSIIGITFIHFTGKLCQNLGLRNKVYEMMISKWQEQDIEKINPPFNPAYSDYLQECHVKLPKNKVIIQPQSKRALRKLEQKVNKFQSQKYNDISFSDPSFK